MRFLRVPPAEGVAWVRRAFQAFFRQPFGFAGLFAACALVVFGLTRIPVLGAFILVVLVPSGTLVFMIAVRRAVAGEQALPGAFVELMAGPNARRIELVKLGIAYLVATFLAALAAVLIITIVDDSLLPELMQSASAPQTNPATSEISSTDPRLKFVVLLTFGLGALLAVPFWHAPGLVWWGAQGWAKALFFSTVAIWRNKGAFAVFGLVWLVLTFAIKTLLIIVVALIGEQQTSFVATSIFFFISTVLYASLWFTFAGCFAEAASEPEVPAP